MLDQTTRDVKTPPVLKLVPVSAGHARRLAGLAGDEESPPWATAPQRSPLENVLAFIARAQRLRAREACDTFAVFDADRLVGLAVLARDPSVPDQAELGYWIAEPDRGRGHATAAARRLLSHAFGRLNLAVVFARCPSANRASARVLERLRFAASEPSPGLTSGADPVRRYELTHHEWLGRAGACPPPASPSPISRRGTSPRPTSATPRPPP